MSRTYKDKSHKFFPEEQWEFDILLVPYTRVGTNYHTGESVEYESFIYLHKPGVKTKKKRCHQERNWMTTPMWWIREFHTQPQRTRGKEWERKVVDCPIDELIDEDTPSVGRKPHHYYW